MDHIVLTKYTQPYDPRGWAWMAYLADNDALGVISPGIYGFGATELSAFNDLLRQMPSD